MSAVGQQRLLSRIEGEDRKQKIEVIVRQTEAYSSLEIRSLGWGRGIGWYVQKTIVLDPTQVRTLARALRRLSVMEAKPAEKGKVIPFPARKEHD